MREARARGKEAIELRRVEKRSECAGEEAIRMRGGGSDPVGGYGPEKNSKLRYSPIWT